MKINFLCIIPNVKKNHRYIILLVKNTVVTPDISHPAKAFSPPSALLHEPLQPSAVEITNFL